MMRPRLNHATVVAYFALVVALSGSAWAVAVNSIGTKELKRGAVHTSDIYRGAVTKKKLATAYKNRLEFARVQGDGDLVDGTAVNAYRFGQPGSGTYFVKFKRPIHKCAGTVTAGSFPDYNGSIYRISTHIGIANQEGGGFNDRWVSVQLWDNAGSDTDSSFLVVLACP